jgi:hypothetical protein
MSRDPNVFLTEWINGMISRAVVRGWQNRKKIDPVYEAYTASLAKSFRKGIAEGFGLVAGMSFLLGVIMCMHPLSIGYAYVPGILFLVMVVASFVPTVGQGPDELDRTRKVGDFEDAYVELAAWLGYKYLEIASFSQSDLEKGAEVKLTQLAYIILSYEEVHKDDEKALVKAKSDPSKDFDKAYECFEHFNLVKKRGFYYRLAETRRKELEATAQAARRRKQDEQNTSIS